MNEKQMKSAMTAWTTICAAALVAFTGPASAAIEPRTDEPLVAVPAQLASASDFLGVGATPLAPSCDTFTLPDPYELAGLEFHTGTGHDGVLEQATRNGKVADPQKLLELIEHHAEQGDEWAEIITKGFDTCKGGFAFAICVEGNVLQLTGKVLFCFVCCGNPVSNPHATCDLQHGTAACWCQPN